MALHSPHLSASEEISLRRCPRCTQQVPDWASSCQFCGAPVAGGPTRDLAITTRRGGLTRTSFPAKILFAYYLSAAWWVLAGVYEAASVSYAFGPQGKGFASIPAAGSIFGLNPYALALGSLTALFGLAILVDSSAIRKAASLVAGTRLLIQLAFVGLFLFGALKPGLGAAMFLGLSVGNIVSSLVLVAAVSALVADRRG